MALAASLQPKSPSRTFTTVSWAKIIGSNRQENPLEPPLHLQKDHFLKLKNSIQICVNIDYELCNQAKDNMSSSLYAKFMGKTLPLDQAKLALVEA